jgi:hypothetical protein
MPAGRISFAAMAILLLAVALPVPAQPFPSLPLDTTRWTIPDANGPAQLSAAFGDSLGLVVWSDGDHVKACRLNRDLAVLDSVCLNISGLVLPSWPVDVACSGDNFLVVWQQAGLDYRILASLVTQDGEIGRPATLDSFTPGPVQLSVAFNGANYVVVWSFESAKYARVSPLGLVLDSARSVWPRQGVQTEVDIAAGDSMSLVVFYRGADLVPFSEVYGRLIRPDGSLVDTEAFLIHRPLVPGRWPGLPAIGYAAPHFVVAWQEFDERTESTDVMVTLVTQDGVVLDSVGVEVDHSIYPYGPSVASCRDTVLVTWIRRITSSACELTARRFDGELRPLDTSVIVVSGPDTTAGPSMYYRPAAASQGSAFLVAWAPLLNPWLGRSATYRCVSTTGQVLDTADVVVSLAANEQRVTGIVSDGHDFMAMWRDWRDSSGRTVVCATRFDAAGNILGQTGMRIGVPAWQYAGACLGGGFYLMCFWSSGSLCAMRFTTEGVPVDSVPVMMPSSARWAQNCVAASGSVFMVTWEHGTGDIHGARLGFDGTLLDTLPILIQIRPTFAHRPQVASDGGAFLVVHRDDEARALHGVRLSSEGRILDTAEILIGRTGYDDPGRICFGGGVYLVAQDRKRKAWPVDPGGKVLDSLGADLPRGFGGDYSMAFDGANFIIVSTCGAPPLSKVGGLRISPAGVLLDSEPIVLCELGAENWGPRLPIGVAAAAGSVGLAFSSYAWAPFECYRARAAVFPPISGMASDGPARLPSGSGGFEIVANPARGRVTLALILREPVPVRVDVFDPLGRLRLSRFCGTLQRGGHRLSVDADGLGGGVYVVSVEPGLGRRKMVVVR